MDNEKNKTILICFVLFKFMDSISYVHIFKYSHELFGFNPHILHTDYELAIEKAIHNTVFFREDLIHIKCFFHFVKSLREHLKKCINSDRYLSKKSYIILKNY